jgi:hypothetical protein
LTAPAVTIIYDSIVSYSHEEEINIFVLANERWLRHDKPLEEFQGHAPTEHFVIEAL